MNEFYEAKFKELFIEFNRYLLEHPEFASQIPANAQIVLLDQQDANYSLAAIKAAQQSHPTDDDFPDRPIVYIEVREMAPVRSRLRRVNVLTSPPQYAP